MYVNFSNFTSLTQFNAMKFERVLEERTLKEATNTLILALGASVDSINYETLTETDLVQLLSDNTNRLSADEIDWISYALIIKYKGISYYYDYEGMPLSSSKVNSLKEVNNQEVRESLFELLKEKALKDTKYNMLFMAFVIYFTTEQTPALGDLNVKAFAALFCLANKQQTFDKDILF